MEIRIGDAYEISFFGHSKTAESYKSFRSDEYIDKITHLFNVFFLLSI